MLAFVSGELFGLHCGGDPGLDRSPIPVAVVVARRHRDILPVDGGVVLDSPTTPGVTLGGVVHHHGVGVHAGQGVHAALPRRVQAGGLQLQLVVAGHLDERAPAECPLEPRPEPGERGGAAGDEKQRETEKEKQ